MEVQAFVLSSILLQAGSFAKKSDQVTATIPLRDEE
jgi:hypothetical protein